MVANWTSWTWWFRKVHACAPVRYHNSHCMSGQKSNHEHTQSLWDKTLAKPWSHQGYQTKEQTNKSFECLQEYRALNIVKQWKSETLRTPPVLSSYTEQLDMEDIGQVKTKVSLMKLQSSSTERRQPVRKVIISVTLWGLCGKRATKRSEGLWEHKGKDSLAWWYKNGTMSIFGKHQALLIIWPIPSLKRHGPCR